MTPLIDIGCNLTHKALLPHIEEIAHQCQHDHIEHIIITGTSVTESHQAFNLTQQYPGFLYSTAGVHPHDAKDWNSDTIDSLKQLLDYDTVKAVGETGLDFNRNYSPKEHQISAFEQQVELAILLQKPLFLHQSDAHDAFFSVLKNSRDKLPPVVVHCFTDTKKALFDYLDEGFYIGITGWICDPKRGKELQIIANNIPINRLMIETDAPYLLPKTLLPKPKSNNNQPYYLPHIAQTLANLYELPYDLLSSHTRENSLSFFNLQ